MKIRSSVFEFTSYRFDNNRKQLIFCYKVTFESKKFLTYNETVVLPKTLQSAKIPDKVVDNLLFNLHLMLGISYFKLFLPEKIKLNKPITYEQSVFWNTVYKKGLGEFCYRNRINPNSIARFPFDKNFKYSFNFEFPVRNRCLVGIGGGKDSVVAAELLKQNNQDITAFIVQTQKEAIIQNKICKVLNIPNITVKRILDKNIFQPHTGSLSGHLPISAIYAFLGLTCAIFYDYKYVVTGNEKSSDYGNTTYQGETVNHQWSKSVEFEQLFQKYVRDYISHGIIFFSLLRPFYDIRVAEMFSQFPKYFPYFSSCNRNFSVKNNKLPRWCNRCPKCLSTFTLLSPFIIKRELIKIFGQNLYQNRTNLTGFKDILGLGLVKPFECVGTADEIKAAFWLARKNYGNDLAIKTFLPKINNTVRLISKVFKSYPADSIPTQHRFLGMKNALILGFGREGKKTKQYLAQNYPGLKIGIADQKSDPDYLDKQKNFDIAIKTPGIPKEKMAIQYTTATNIFFSQVKNITIGVTGSKGKSTTASLIYSILIEANYKSLLLGNIGKPMLESLLNTIDKESVIVLELSSYQLDDILYSPHIAVVLNLFPEHLDYHRSLNNYYRAKQNIINFQKSKDFFIYNPKYNILENWSSKAISQAIPYVQDLPISDQEIPLLGEHNRENIKAATTVGRLLNIPGIKIRNAITKFKALPHRLEFVGNYRGIDFYDDAISTAPQSTIAAIKAIPNITTLFLGGTDRGYNFTLLEKTIKLYKINNLVLFPPSGNRIITHSAGLNILKTENMKEAVDFAFKYTKSGSVCLLSTASPSYSLWKNFEEKGGQYKYYVRSFTKN